MKETIEVIYEKGLLRPLSKVRAAEGQRIRITVENDEDDPAGADQRAKNMYDFSDLAGCLRSNPRFSADPVAVQKELRNEWS